MRPDEPRGATVYRILTALIAGMLVAAAAAAASGDVATSSGSKASVDPKVVNQIATHGQTTFWVILREQANLAPARSLRPSPRGQYVYNSLTSTADRTQAPLKALLAQRHVRFKSFWILNSLRVTAGGSVLRSLAARPEVAKILPDVTFKVPRVTPGHRESVPGTVEWGLTNIHAPQVWTNFQRSRRGHRRRKHRHRCPLHAQRACHEVPRPEHERHLRPQLQLE